STTLVTLVSRICMKATTMTESVMAHLRAGEICGGSGDVVVTRGALPWESDAASRYDTRRGASSPFPNLPRGFGCAGRARARSQRSWGRWFVNDAMPEFFDTQLRSNARSARSRHGCAKP